MGGYYATCALIGLGFAVGSLLLTYRGGWTLKQRLALACSVFACFFVLFVIGKDFPAV